LNGLVVIEEEFDNMERLNDLGNQYFIEDECELFDIFISFP
jgi:hypothetical protein